MSRTKQATPWPVLLAIASFLCPTELSLYVGNARLPPHRVLLLLLVPIAASAMLDRRRVKLHTFDFAFFAFAGWTVTVYMYHHGPVDGLQSGGALALDAFGSYLVARAFVRDSATLMATAGALVVGVALSGLMALPETLSGQNVMHDIMRQITGYVHPTGNEKRMGLTRAFGTFDHPIHMGSFCASGLALAVYAAGNSSAAAMRGLTIALSALLSLSSAPMLSLGAQASLIFYERFTRAVPNRFTILIGAIVAVFSAISMVASRSPFALIATGMTLDPWTGYYRLMIWESGLGNVWANPLFGLGLNDWERPMWMVSNTIDSFWLVIAMRGGIPSFVFLVSAIFFLARTIAIKAKDADKASARMAAGWMISLTTLILVGCTVHYWNVPFAYFFFILGLGGALADPRSGAKVKSAAAVSVAKRKASVRWVAPAAVQRRDPGAPSPVGPRNLDGFGPVRWPVPERS